MKRPALSVLLVAALALTIGAQAPQQRQMTLDEVQKALCLVDKPQAAPEKYKAGLEAITAADTIAMLSFISSDWMEGRDTASRGYQIAADYAAALMKSWGVKPAGDMPALGGAFRAMGRGQAPAAPPERSYFQEFAMREVGDTASSLTVEVLKGEAVVSHVFKSGIDFQGAGSSNESLTAPVVFAGYGIRESAIGWDDFKGLDVKGKIVLVLSEAPGKGDPKSPFEANKELKDKYFPAGGAMMAMAMRGGGGPGRFNKTLEIAKLGPAAILQVQNTGSDADIYRALSTVRRPSDERPINTGQRRRLSIPGAARSPFEAGSPVVNITREMADVILAGAGQTIDQLKAKIESAFKPASAALPGTRVSLASTAETRLVRCKNVLGMIEGSDPALKDEVFVIGAHFDHLGAFEDYIYNGADDNGSGSIGVLNIAKAMAVNPVKPKRTVVFALWTGEEKGLLGSRYYVQNPVFPIAKTIGYLNYDMISRPFDEVTLARSTRPYAVAGAEDMVKKIRPPLFATVNVTENSGLVEITKEMNAYIGLDLALRENALGAGSGGSDHSSFASVKVPYVYYMAAMTADYHQTSDSVEKVSGDLLARISRIGYLTAFAYADK